MRSVNKVILIGNLTRDPELKTTSSGQSIVTFGMATNRQWTTSSGEKRNSAEFHDVVGWAALAEICQQYLKKGMLVYIEGYLKTRSWDTEEGVRKFRTEIVLQDMIILEKRKDGESIGEMPEEEGMETEKPAPTMGGDDAAVEEETPIEEPVAEETPGELSANIDDDDMF